MHSRIYQVSKEPIKEFIDEYRYEDNFVGRHADYVDLVEHESEDYISDLKWLQNATKGLEVNLKKGTVKVLSKKDYFEEKHEQFKEYLKKLQDITLADFTSRKNRFDILDLESAYNDKYSFYVDDNDEYYGITTLDDWVRSVEENETYYIGSIFDYHF